MMRSYLKLILRGLLVLLAIALLGGGAWGVWRWKNYPACPNVKTADLDASIAFMGTDDFNRMFESHRYRYAMAVVERMKEKSLEELIAMMMKRDPARRAVAKNIQAIPNHEEIGGAMMQNFFDKFYQAPEVKRTGYLTLLAVAQGTGKVPMGPPGKKGFVMPSPDQLKKDMTRFLSHQPPRTQAQVAQFMVDLHRQRQLLGYREPWE